MQFLSIIQNQNMWGGVIATISFVLIGFFATKMNFLNKEVNAKLSKFTLTWIFPFLCLNAFMVNADKEHALVASIVIGLSIFFYAFFIFLTWIIVKHYPQMISKRISLKAEEIYANIQQEPENLKTTQVIKDQLIDNLKAKLVATELMIMFGSLQFFAYPLVISLSTSLFEPFSLALAQVWCIPYMIGLFGYIPIMLSGKKISKKDIKPIFKSLASPTMICLYISLLLWILQFIPALNSHYAMVNDKPYQLVENGEGQNFWAALKTNIPAIGNTLNIGGALISPLSWITIGGALAASNIKEAAKDKGVWITTVRKLFVLPLVIFILSLGIFYGLSKGTNVSAKTWVATATLLVLLAATPPATVTTVYAIANKHPYAGYIAQVSALSTLLSIVFMPLWVIISNVTFTALF